MKLKSIVILGLFFVLSILTVSQADAQWGGIGHLKDSVTGNPVANATITKLSGNGTCSSQTESDGSFGCSFTVISASATLRFTKTNFETSTDTIEGGRNYLDPVLENPDTLIIPYGRIKGVVKDAATQAVIQNALVVAGSANDLTNSTGDYILWVPAGQYTVSCSKTGYIPGQYTNVPVTAGNATFRNFNLQQ